jgi:excisionase family DNA binding protein
MEVLAMRRSNKIKTIGVEDASKVLNVCYATALRMAKRGDLPCLRLGRQYLILREPFERMLKQAPSSKSCAA